MKLKVLIAAILTLTSTTLLARQQITGPTGVVPMGSTAQLTWPPTLWSGNPPTVDIRLSHGVVNQMMIAGAPNNGHASITLPVPPALPCNPSELYWFTMGPSGATTTKFTMSCPPPPAGALKVVKTVVNSTGGPAPTIPASFNMVLNCTPTVPGIRSTIAVNVGAAGLTIPALPVNSSCRVAETPPAPLLRLEGCKGGGASWTTTMSPATPVTILSGATTTITVTNTLKCEVK
jgi:hypothetical protein